MLEFAPRTINWRDDREYDPVGDTRTYLQKLELLMMKSQYYVVGGVYKDFTFKRCDFGPPVPDELFKDYLHEQNYRGWQVLEGPFDMLEDAKAKWRELAWANVDNALHRVYVIESPFPLQPFHAKWYDQEQF